MRKPTVNRTRLDEIISNRLTSGVSLSIEKVVSEESERWAISEAAKRYYGSWTNALIKNGATPNGKYVVTERDILVELYRLKSNGLELKIANFPTWLRTALSKNYGGWKPVKEKFGITNSFSDFKTLEDRLTIESGYLIYTREEIDKLIYRLIVVKRSEGISNISARTIREYDDNLLPSIQKLYGTLTDYFSQLDINYYTKPYVPFRWDAENIKRQLMRWIREGTPVNYTYVATKHRGILDASRRFYGGWEQLFKSCNLNYDDYRTDTNMASYFGRQLEDVFEEILIALGVEYEREPNIKRCRPDFTKGTDWLDVKLSEWTIHISDCDTIKKYEPHCDSLTIVFLRGNKTINKQITDKTRLVNINHYIEQLPREKRGYFYEQLNEIEAKLDEKQTA